MDWKKRKREVKGAGSRGEVAVKYPTFGNEGSTEARRFQNFRLARERRSMKESNGLNRLCKKRGGYAVVFENFRMICRV